MPKVQLRLPLKSLRIELGRRGRGFVAYKPDGANRETYDLTDTEWAVAETLKTHHGDPCFERVDLPPEEAAPAEGGESEGGSTDKTGEGSGSQEVTQ